MIDNGWIKIHRKILHAPYYKDSQYVHLWVHLIMCAWHREAKYLDGNTIKILKPGQFITGRKKLSADTGINEHKIDRILKVFESEQQIEQVTTSRNRLISIVSWDKYQKVEQQNEQQMSNERATDEQRMSTKEECIKNDKNKKNNTSNLILPENLKEIWGEWIDYKKTELKKAYKTTATEQKGVNELVKISKGDPVIARAIVDRSIAHQWQGLFELPKSSTATNHEQKLQDARKNYKPTAA